MLREKLIDFIAGVGDSEIHFCDIDDEKVNINNIDFWLMAEMVGPYTHGINYNEYVIIIYTLYSQFTLKYVDGCIDAVYVEDLPFKIHKRANVPDFKELFELFIG